MYRTTIAVVLLALAAPALARNAVTVKFEEAAVVATVTPGARTAWFSIAHESDARGLRVVNRAFTLPDDDRDGVVRFAMNRPAPTTSFWMVVDMTSGEHAIESPGGDIALNRRALPPSALMWKDNKGAKARLQHQLPRMTVFVVRPGVGAWYGKIDDGSAGDGDGAVDGRITSLIDGLKPIDTSSPPSPDDFQRDDIVAFVEPLGFTIFDGRVVK